MSTKWVHDNNVYYYTVTYTSTTNYGTLVHSRLVKFPEALTKENTARIMDSLIGDYGAAVMILPGWHNDIRNSWE